MSGRVTLEQVATAAGVSAAAASLALRGKPGVAEDTRQRILDAAGRVGYQIRATAEVPAEFTIGMLVITRTRGTPEATYGPLMGAITQACSGVGVDVRLGTLVVDESDRPMEVPRLVGQAGIDGFLVIGPWLSSAAASLLGDRPIVLVDGDAEDRDTHSSVVSDDAGGAADATSALIAAGHRRIVLAGATTGIGGATAERRRGYDEAMAEAGLEPRYVDRPTQDPPTVAAAVGQELRRGRRFSAVVAVNDAIAIAILGELGARGVPVPASVSVIGFDDIEAARLVRPRLSTVTVNKPAMGRLATSMLFHRMDHPDDPPFTVVQRARLVRRDSVANVGQSDHDSGHAAVPNGAPS